MNKKIVITDFYVSVVLDFSVTSSLLMSRLSTYTASLITSIGNGECTYIGTIMLGFVPIVSYYC